MLLQIIHLTRSELLDILGSKSDAKFFLFQSSTIELYARRHSAGKGIFAHLAVLMLLGYWIQVYR